MCPLPYLPFRLPACVREVWGGGLIKGAGGAYHGRLLRSYSSHCGLLVTSYILGMFGGLRNTGAGGGGVAGARVA